ncbi:GntR family transcriptional regulator [Saccharopolyspora phatthalungensis]|uniref:DNA-binding GntR family transcriptional regulator n=1 Tax=Saccharopolyspora phatthalungensis TaxID=664693 RepID=A0A840QBE7_9PSEU|nr:GntR family transcriptional regulator [Saccharopolyspora phatthalungensis]MBB5157267.1 DNA-binding GntR family transcriptional regulator [Saccharopolyspora phatthalungensis]
MSLRLQALSIIDALAEDLRTRIFRGELAGGTRLTETELATKYDVARPTAKAAIEKLVTEGLLRRDVHKTARIPHLDVGDIEDLYLSRACIEKEVARRLAPGRIVPEAARKAQADIVAAGDTWTIDIVEPDVRFHQSLVDAVGSSRTSRLYQVLMGEMRLCMAQIQSYGVTRASVISAEHQAILDQIEAADADAAARTVANHLERACRDLTRSLRATTTYGEAESS